MAIFLRLRYRLFPCIRNTVLAALTLIVTMSAAKAIGCEYELVAYKFSEINQKLRSLSATDSIGALRCYREFVKPEFFPFGDVRTGHTFFSDYATLLERSARRAPLLHQISYRQEALKLAGFWLDWYDGLSLSERVQLSENSGRPALRSNQRAFALAIDAARSLGQNDEVLKQLSELAVGHPNSIDDKTLQIWIGLLSKYPWYAESTRYSQTASFLCSAEPADEAKRNTAKVWWLTLRDVISKRAANQPDRLVERKVELFERHPEALDCLQNP